MLISSQTTTIWIKLRFKSPSRKLTLGTTSDKALLAETGEHGLKVVPCYTGIKNSRSGGFSAWPEGAERYLLKRLRLGVYVKE
jgi:hypothetical protein